MGKKDPKKGSWLALNKELMAASEAQAAAMLEAEQAGQNRLSFVLRIKSRMDRMRRARERRELGG